MGRVVYQGHEHPEDQLSLVLIQPHKPWYNASPSISRSGRATGRPRKQYFVRWEPSWVDAGYLTAPELLLNWKEKKALKGKR